MVERICPACQHGNHLENRFCGACGNPLRPDALASRPQTTLTIAGRTLPTTQIADLGKVVALGLVTVAAEAGLAWLRRRAERAGVPAPVVQQPTAAIAPRSDPTAAHVVTIISQRVVEVWEQGGLTRQVVERHVWRKEG